MTLRAFHNNLVSKICIAHRVFISQSLCYKCRRLPLSSHLSADILKFALRLCCCCLCCCYLFRLHLCQSPVTPLPGNPLACPTVTRHLFPRTSFRFPLRLFGKFATSFFLLLLFFFFFFTSPSAIKLQNLNY